MESMQRVIKQLTNEIIYLEKNKGEGKKPLKPFMKKRTDSAPQIPPTLGINIKDYAMENYCRTQEPPKREKMNDKEEDEEDQQEEEEDEEGEEPPSHLNLIWDEE